MSTDDGAQRDPAHGDRAPRRASRRSVLRTTVWSAPVVLTAAAAPAMAASVGPLTVTGFKDTLGLQLVLTFSGGDPNLPVTITSVTTRVLTTYSIAMSPTTGISSVGGKSYGALLSSLILLTLVYTVTYTFNGRTYVTTVSV